VVSVLKDLSMSMNKSMVLPILIAEEKEEEYRDGYEDGYEDGYDDGCDDVDEEIDMKRKHESGYEARR